MTRKQEMGERLKIARRIADLKQEDVARFVGVGKSTVSEWETGKRSPDIELFADLATILDTSVAYLLGVGAPISSSDEYKLTEYNAASRSEAALCIARDFDRLDEYGQHVLRTTADLLLGKHRSSSIK
jgi:transcriptional regulator with XRE-family HTH domain